MTATSAATKMAADMSARFHSHRYEVDERVGAGGGEGDAAQQGADVRVFIVGLRS